MVLTFWATTAKASANRELDTAAICIADPSVTRAKAKRAIAVATTLRSSRRLSELAKELKLDFFLVCCHLTMTYS